MSNGYYKLLGVFKFIYCRKNKETLQPSYQHQPVYTVSKINAIVSMEKRTYSTC